MLSYKQYLLEEQEDKIAYHKTNEKAVDNILSVGFQPSKSGYYGKGLYSYLKIPKGKVDGKGNILVSFYYGNLKIFLEHDNEFTDKEMRKYNIGDSVVRIKLLEKYGYDGFIIPEKQWLIILPKSVNKIDKKSLNIIKRVG